MPASSPSNNIDVSTTEHDDSSPSVRTHPLDLDPSQTSASIPTQHLIQQNIEPIARLQHERVVQELKRMSSSSIPSPVLIPTRTTSSMDGRVLSTGYASPLPMDERERERQLASPLPQQEHYQPIDTNMPDIILSSPAFAMAAPTPITTIPLTSSNLAQHDRIDPPIQHLTTHVTHSTATTTIPAYHPNK